MVQRPVPIRLLQRLPRSQSPRPLLWRTPLFSRRLLATPHQNLALLHPLQHPARLPLRRLRLPRRLLKFFAFVITRRTQSDEGSAFSHGITSPTETLPPT